MTRLPKEIIDHIDKKPEGLTSIEVIKYVKKDGLIRRETVIIDIRDDDYQWSSSARVM